MDPWPPAGPEHRRTLTSEISAGRGRGGGALRWALRRQMRPGSDVAVAGAGAGLLALHVARAGARRIYILGEGPSSQIGRVLAAASGLGSRLRILGAGGRRVRPPVDLIILGAGGTTPPWALPLWAAVAWLRCGGSATRVSPPWLDITVAPTRDPILHGAAAAFWRRGVAGVRLRGAARALLQAPILTRAARMDWLAPPVMVRYPLAGLARLRIHASFRVTGEGPLTGVALRASPPDGGPERVTAQEQGLLLPLPEAMPVERGSLVRTEITWEPGRAGGRWEWRWAVEGAGGAWKRGRRAHGTGEAQGGKARAARWAGGWSGGGHPGANDSDPRAD